MHYTMLRVLYSVSMITLICTIVGCSSIPESRLQEEEPYGLNTTNIKSAETYLSKTASDLLSSKLAESESQVALQSLRIAAKIENEGSREGYTVSGVSFWLLVAEKPDPRFIYGSVGTGKTIAEARQNAFNEWVAVFLDTFARAFSDSPDYIESSRMRIYASTLIVRGDGPNSLNYDALTRAMLEPYIPIVNKTVLYGATQLKDIQTIVISTVFDDNGGMDGQWQFNGKIIPGTMASARPELIAGTRSAFMVKQLYIFKGTQTGD